MHKATFLEGTLRFTIVPDGPILIKAGESSGVDPVLPDMRFVRSQGQIYIPGPSLKGVVRAQAERICRSLDNSQLQAQKLQARRETFGLTEQLIPLADNPLAEQPKKDELTDTMISRLIEETRYSSGRYIEAEPVRESIKDDPKRTAIIYRRTSFTSQIFGHTSLAGRVRFADAYSADLKPSHIEERNGVAIDRIYGSVAVGPFNYEVVVGGTFTSRIDFKNLTLAQLGLLGLALRDLADGRVGIGFGKSRGLGRVKVTFEQMHLSYPTCELKGKNIVPMSQMATIAENTLAGIGALCPSAEYASYALPKHDSADLQDITYHTQPILEQDQTSETNTRNRFASLAAGLHCVPDNLFGVYLVARGHDAVRAIWRACMPAWRQEIGL